MPEEEKKTVDIDTSGPEVDIDIEQPKDEAVVETDAPKEETRTYEKKKDHGTDISYENERETKLEEKETKEDDSKLEEYSKGVQKRIDKLTAKLREAERREQAATDFASNVQKENETLKTKTQELDENYILSQK